MSPSRLVQAGDVISCKDQKIVFGRHYEVTTSNVENRTRVIKLDKTVDGIYGRCQIIG